MRYDLFEFRREMTRTEVVMRVIFLAIVVGVLALDLLFFYP
jgi:hypothetical protein